MNASSPSYQNNLPQEKSFPDELRKWNWGAFLLNWIWGLGNRTYIALLACVPIVNIVMMFVLGAKGNEWAWRNKHWDNIEHFKRVQRLWSIWAVSIFGVLMASCIAMAFFAVLKLTDIEVVKMAVNSASKNTLIIEKIGSPIEKKGWPSGQISISGPNGYMDGSIDVRGPQGTATVHLKAYLENARWNIVYLGANVHKTQDFIEIINYPPNSLESKKFERNQELFLKD